MWPYQMTYAAGQVPDHYTQTNVHVLIQAIAKSIQMEYEALVNYQELAKLAPSEFARNVIEEIRNDEQDHFDSFSHIYRQLTMQEAVLKPIEKIKDYPSGLNFSIVDELKTSEYYQQIYLMSQDPYIRETYLHAMNDETRHAVWFQYLLFQFTPELTHHFKIP